MQSNAPSVVFAAFTGNRQWFVGTYFVAHDALAGRTGAAGVCRRQPFGVFSRGGICGFVLCVSALF